MDWGDGFGEMQNTREQADMNFVVDRMTHMWGEEET